MKKTRLLLISLAAALLLTFIAGSGVLLRLDKMAQDALFQHPGVTSSDIVVIGIDEEAFDALGPYNTWTRDVMAEALKALAEDPDNLPAVVAIDVLYIGNTTEGPDTHLAEAARKLGNVVTAAMAVFGESVTWENGRPVAVNSSSIISYEQPYEELRNVTVQGHINAMTDKDGVLRHALLYVEPEGKQVLSMAATTAKLYLESRGRELSLPKDVRHLYVPFTGRPGDYYDSVSVANLLYREVPPEYWKDKIVLIGPYAAALQDAYFTSISKGEAMYGIEFQANVIQSLIEGNFKTDIPELPQLILLFVICFASAFLFLRLKPIRGLILCAGLAALGIGLPYLLYRLGYVSHIVWFAPAVLLLYILAIAMHYLRAAKERRALALEKERIGAELALAARIQANSLPREFPPFPDRKEFDIYASMKPAKEVGGDLYDFFMIDEDHLGLVIGDVSGKGVPAALFMMVATALIRNAAMSEKDAAKALMTVNKQICSRNPDEMFVTVWLGVLEISTGKLTAANAGHEYPALKMPDGSFELVKDKHGLVIGGMDGVRYREYELHLEPGAKLFLYTDGLPEANSAGGDFFSTDRMMEALHACENGSVSEIIDSVKKAVSDFVGKADQFDDLTMLCLQYNCSDSC